MVFDTIPNKLYTLYVKRFPEGEEPIEKRKSPNKIPTGRDVLTLLVQEQNHHPLRDAGQKAVVEIFPPKRCT